MVAVLVIIAIFIVMILTFFIIEVLSYYSDIKDKHTIRFDDFLRLYSVAPDKWNTSYYWEVIYDGVSIHMKSYLDSKRYKHWRNNKQQIELNRCLTNQQMELLKKWQKDINQYQEKYTSELNKMLTK